MRSACCPSISLRIRVPATHSFTILELCLSRLMICMQYAGRAQLAIASLSAPRSLIMMN